MQVSGQLRVPVTSSPGKEPLVPTEQGAGCAPLLVWTWWWKEKFLPYPGYPACCLVIIQSQLAVWCIVPLHNSIRMTHDSVTIIASAEEMPLPRSWLG